LLRLFPPKSKEFYLNQLVKANNPSQIPLLLYLSLSKIPYSCTVTSRSIFSLTMGSLYRQQCSELSCCRRLRRRRSIPYLQAIFRSLLSRKLSWRLLQDREFLYSYCMYLYPIPFLLVKIVESMKLSEYSSL